MYDLPTIKPAPAQAPSRNKTIRNLRSLLTAEFPQCFSVVGERKRPLKIGIHWDLFERWGLPDSKSRATLMLALRRYVSVTSYHRIMLAGATRVDLDGNAAGAVTERQARRAARIIAEFEAHKKARREAHELRQMSVAEIARYIIDDCGDIETAREVFERKMRGRRVNLDTAMDIFEDEASDELLRDATEEDES